MATNKQTGKYFTVEVRPTVTADLANSAAMVADDVVFDWTAFKLRGGTNRLVGVTVVAPPTNAGAAQDCPIDLLFATQTQGNGGIAAGAVPQSIGTINSKALPTANPYFNDLIGAVKIDATDCTDTEPRSVCVTGVAQGGMNPVLFEPYGSNEDDEGRHTYYVAAIASAVVDFRSGVLIAEADFGDGEQTTITVDTVDACKYFAPGDVIHADGTSTDNAVLGTISSITNGTTIVLTAANTEAAAENDTVLNINPIILRFTFERA